MSATDRKMKMAELRIENNNLRDDRNAHVRTNAELLKECDALRAENERLREALELFMECPYVIDEASVPKGGIEKNPSQVVGVMSVSIIKIRKARTALSSLLVKDGE